MGCAIYGAPPPGLASAPADARQLSPFTPGADLLEELADGALDGIVVAAPAGALERRYVLAQALRTLKPGGELVALAPRNRGGGRLRKELESMGVTVRETARRHHRVCLCRRPSGPLALAAPLADGGPQRPAALGLWSQPGLFSWDRIDPGSGLLSQHVHDLAGDGADLGCGVGVLSLAVLTSPEVASLALVDLDRRAIEASRRNVADARVHFIQADVTAAPPPGNLDFVVMNPPFHLGGDEDRRLGQAFIAAAARALKPGGVCRMVANVGLPYEQTLRARFATVRPIGQDPRYKVFEAWR